MRALLLISILLFASLSFASKKDGPETGGGGNAVFIDNQFHLLDLFNSADLDAIHLKAIQTNPELGRFDFAEHPEKVRKLVQDIFGKWGIDTSPFALSRHEMWMGREEFLIKRPVQVTLSEIDISPSSFYWPFYLPVFSKVYQAAYYNSLDHSIVISSKIWNRLGSVSKLGLLIHEYMRHVQKGLGHQFNDEILQKATLVMLVCEPQFNSYLIPLSIENEIVHKKIFELSDKIQSCLKN